MGVRAEVSAARSRSGYSPFKKTLGIDAHIGDGGALPAHVDLEVTGPPESGPPGLYP